MQSFQSPRLTQVTGVCCEVTGRRLVVKSVRNVGKTGLKAGVCLIFTVVANIREFMDWTDSYTSTQSALLAENYRVSVVVKNL